MRILLLPALGVVLATGAPAPAQDRHSFGGGQDLRAPTKPIQDIQYGPDSEQEIKLSRPGSEADLPLVIHIDGRAWQDGARSYSTDWLRAGFYEEGMAFASIGFEARRSTRVEEIVPNIVAGVRKLFEDAEDMGLDSRRVFLLGTGSGGHLALLLATDESLLGESVLNSIQAVAILNGDGFDIPERIQASTAYRGAIYRRVFGTDPQVQAELSPVHHLAAPNVDRVLLLSTEGDEDPGDQAESLAARLRASGISVTRREVPRWRDAVLRSYFGAPGNESFDELVEYFQSSIAEAR